MTLLLRPFPLGYPSLRMSALVTPGVLPVNPIVRFSLFLFVLSIPFELPNRTIPFELPTATAALFLLTTVLNPSVCFRKVPAALWFFAGYVWLLIISAFVNDIEQISLATKAIAQLLLVLLVSWTAFNLLADARVVRTVLVAVVIGCAVRAAIQLLGIGTTTYTLWVGGERVTALGQNANLSAMILSAGIATVVGLQLLADVRWPRYRLLTWPLAALMAAAIVQGGSRGGLLCALVGLLVYCFRGRNLPIRMRNAFFGIVAVVGLGYAALHNEGMSNRIEEARHGNMAGREKIYPAALGMIVERPIIGWGPWDNQFEVARRIGERVRPSRDMHNLFLEVASSSGLLGFGMFLTGLLLTLRSAWRANKGPLGALPFGVLVAVLVGTISGTWVVSKILWLVITLALAAGAHWREPAPPALEAGAA